MKPEQQMARKNGHMINMKRKLLALRMGKFDKRKLGGRFDRFDFSES